jgi:maltooligosyltrehalose synthase
LLAIQIGNDFARFGLLASILSEFGSVLSLLVNMAVYQNTTLGYCLVDSLELVNQEFGLSDAVTKTILRQFERSLGTALEQVPNTINITGTCSNFRDVNNVWRLDSTQLKATVGHTVVNASNTIVVFCAKPK